jgi:VIT1/CCC1 family predicted Fe2+/Mn2+ transporter
VATILIAPAGALVPVIGVVSLVCLLVLGALSARAGGAPILIGAARVTLWGVLAMLVTAAVGRLTGAVI